MSIGAAVEGIVRIPLRVFEDERGWFCELRRDSALPRPTRRTRRVGPPGGGG